MKRLLVLTILAFACSSAAPPRAAAPQPPHVAPPPPAAIRSPNALTPIVVQRGLRQDQINYLYEHGREFPGVRTQDSFLRSYPYQSLAAQVLG